MHLSTEGYELALQNVIFVPDLRLNILSTERLKRDNCIGYSNWIPHHLFDGVTGKTIAEADGSSGLPILTLRSSGELSQRELSQGELDHFEALDLYYIDTANREISLDLAYRRLGHIGKNLVKKLVRGMSTGMNLKGIDAHEVGDANKRCDECMMGQMKAKPFPLRQPTRRKATRPFEMIHMDLLTGPENALDGQFKYLLVIVDDYTRYSWVYGLKNKDIGAAWSKWLARVVRHHGDGQKERILIKWIRSDNGGEFISGAIQALWRAEGIELELTVSNAHNQVGVAEKAFGDIVSYAVSVLEDAKLPLNLWYEVTRTLTYLKNL